MNNKLSIAKSNKARCLDFDHYYISMDYYHLDMPWPAYMLYCAESFDIISNLTCLRYMRYIDAKTEGDKMVLMLDDKPF